jgi:hypothetical protein
MSKLNFKSLFNEQPDSRFPVYGTTDIRGHEIVAPSNAERAATIEFQLSSLPEIGLAFATLFGLYHTIDEYSKGNKKTAGFIGVLTTLPFIGSIRSLIPQIANFTAEDMALFASKLKTGAKLTSQETQLAKSIAANGNDIKQAVSKLGPKISPVVKEIQTYKLPYISRMGQQSYDELLQKYFMGTIDKNQLVSELRLGRNPSPGLAQFVTKYGVKFFDNEIKQIQDLSKSFKDMPNYSKTSIAVKTAAGVEKNITIQLIDKKVLNQWGGRWLDYLQSGGFAYADNNTVYIVMDNIEGATNAQFADLLYHEIGHIKDPSLTTSPKIANRWATTGMEGVRDLAKSRELADKGLAGTAEYNKFLQSGERKYMLFPAEITVENARILQRMSDNASELRSIYSRKDLLQGLDELISYAKNPTTAKFTKRASTILGYEDQMVSDYFNLLVKKPSAYKDLWTKIAQQADYLKTQINLAAR